MTCQLETYSGVEVLILWVTRLTSFDIHHEISAVNDPHVMHSHCEMVPTIRRLSLRFNLNGKASKANYGKYIRHGAAGERHYSQQSQSEHQTH